MAGLVGVVRLEALHILHLLVEAEAVAVARDL